MSQSPPNTGGLPIIVSLDDPEPMYRQIERELRRLILGGRLAPGTRLPSVRALASDLACSVITTRRAYQELESEGLIRTRQGMGTVVAALAEHEMQSFLREPVEHALREAIREGKRAGMTVVELRRVFDTIIEDEIGVEESEAGDA